MSVVGVGRRRLKDINLIALFIIVGKKSFTSLRLVSSAVEEGSGVMWCK
jgi:hypothetical protein